MISSVLLFGLFAVAAAAVVQGCTGFGFAIVATPLFLLILPPTAAVPLVALLSYFNVVHMLIVARRHVSPRLVTPLALGGVAGVPIGVKLLVMLDGPLVKAAVGALLVLFAALLLAGWTRPIRRPGRVLPLIGFLSGVLGGSTSLPGPPVIVFLSNQAFEKDLFRANIVAYFSIIGLVSLGGYALSGLYTPEVLAAAAWLLPVNIAASFAGVRLAARISQERFRQLTILAAGLMGIVLALENLPVLAQ